MTFNIICIMYNYTISTPFLLIIFIKDIYNLSSRFPTLIYIATVYLFGVRSPGRRQCYVPILELRLINYRHNLL